MSAFCRRARAGAGLALGVFLASLGGGGAANADLLDEIRARGHLIAGVKADYRPFGFRDAEGALIGYDTDVARALAEALGVSARLTPVTSANRLQKLQRGEIDIVVATLGDTRGRRELVTMVEPQYYGDGANVLLRPDAMVSDWQDLRGRTLCSVQGSLWNRLASERLLVETISLNSTREAALALRNGHCTGWLYDEVNLLSEPGQRRLGGLPRVPALALRVPLGGRHRQEGGRRAPRPAARRHPRGLAPRRLPAAARAALGIAALALSAARAGDVAGGRRRRRASCAGATKPENGRSHAARWRSSPAASSAAFPGCR